MYTTRSSRSRSVEQCLMNRSEKNRDTSNLFKIPLLQSLSTNQKIIYKKLLELIEPNLSKSKTLNENVDYNIMDCLDHFGPIDFKIHTFYKQVSNNFAILIYIVIF